MPFATFENIPGGTFTYRTRWPSTRLKVAARSRGDKKERRAGRAVRPARVTLRPRENFGGHPRKVLIRRRRVLPFAVRQHQEAELRGEREARKVAERSAPSSRGVLKYARRTPTIA